MLQKLKSQLLNAFNTHASIGLLTHTNPDGDGLAACLAVQEFLKSYNKNADIILEKTPADAFDFLNAKDRTKNFSDELCYDLIVIIDCHEAYRVGICKPLIEKAKEVIAIDHHQPNEKIENSFTYIDTKMVSAGAIIFEVLQNNLQNLDKEILNYFVTAIYTTILNDTDNFINANVDAKTFEISGKLCSLGLNVNKVVEKFLFNKPAANIKFAGQVLATMQTFYDDKVIFVYSTQKMLKKLNLTNDATAKLTRYLKGIKNMHALVYFHEKDCDKWVISLRSNQINVNKIAVDFGGGGHKNASGCTVNGTIQQLQKQFLDKIKEQLV